MNDFLVFINKIQSPKQNDQIEAHLYYENMMKKEDFGSFLLQVYQNSPNLSFFTLNCLKRWLLIHWNKISQENKKKLIDFLFNIITNDHLVQHYNIVFEILSFIVKINDQTLNMIIEFTPKIISIEFGSNLKYFLSFLSKLLLHKVNEGFYTLFKTFYINIINNFDFLTSDDGCLILKYAIKSFARMNNITFQDIQDLLHTVEFIKYVITNSNNSFLLTECSKFLRSVHRSLNKINNLEIENLCDMLVLNLGRFIEMENDYVVYQFLRTIFAFGLKPCYINVLLSAAKLTSKDYFDFYNNPYAFYDCVYSSSLTAPRAFSHLVIESLFTDFTEAIPSLFNQEVNELSLRIIGFLSKNNKLKRNQEFLEMKLRLLDEALKLNFNDNNNENNLLTQVASKLYLIQNSLEIFNQSKSNNEILLHIIHEHFQIKNVVIQLLLCKIICKITYFSNEIIYHLLDFYPFCLKNSVVKVFEHILKTDKESINDFAQVLIPYEVQSIFSPFENNNKEDDELDNEIDEDMLARHIDILTSLFEFIQDPIIVKAILDKILLIEYESENLAIVSKFLLKIILGKNDEKDNSQLSIVVFQKSINYISASEDPYTALENLGIIILGFISVHTQEFLNTNSSLTLIEFCIALLQNASSSSILIACDIISFVLQADRAIECSNLVSLFIGLFNINENLPLLQLGINNILSSIVLSHLDNTIPLDNVAEIIISIIQKNYLIRIYDKYLTIGALFILHQQTHNDIFNQAASELQKQKELQCSLSKEKWESFLEDLNLPISVLESKDDYPFPAPIQQMNI